MRAGSVLAGRFSVCAQLVWAPTFAAIWRSAGVSVIGLSSGMKKPDTTRAPGLKWVQEEPHQQVRLKVNLVIVPETDFSWGA
jgi:hypothetical protein